MALTREWWCQLRCVHPVNQETQRRLSQARLQRLPQSLSGVIWHGSLRFVRIGISPWIRQEPRDIGNNLRDSLDMQGSRDHTFERTSRNLPRGATNNFGHPRDENRRYSDCRGHGLHNLRKDCPIAPDSYRTPQVWTRWKCHVRSW